MGLTREEFNNSEVLAALRRHKIPFDEEEVYQRIDLIVDALEGKEGTKERLRAFAKAGQAGGEDPVQEKDIPVKDIPDPPQVEDDDQDFLSPQIKWFMETISSPAAQVAWRMLFTIIFFVSYVESIPIFGDAVGAALDVVVNISEVAIASIQNAFPYLLSIIPLPYMNIVGVLLATLFGFIVWPLMAALAFSRQKFSYWIEYMIRLNPNPMGTILAQGFRKTNQTLASLNKRRKNIALAISKGFSQVSDLVGNELAPRLQKGMTSMTTAVKEQGVQKAGRRRKPFSRRTRSSHKWKTQRRNKFVSLYGNGLL
jgi:hypothetical protein